jgi:hypothetical protein
MASPIPPCSIPALSGVSLIAFTASKHHLRVVAIITYLFSLNPKLEIRRPKETRSSEA